MSRENFASLITTILIFSLIPFSSSVSADNHDIPSDLDGYHGQATLVIHDPLTRSSNVTATWNLEVSISDYFGTEELTHPGLGIRKQIDTYLGNSDDFLDESEVESFESYIINSRNLSDSELLGCCMVDNLPFSIDSMEINVTAPQPGSVMEKNGSWGWTETVEMSGQTDSRSTRIIDLPRTGAVVEEVPLIITLSPSYEFKYSAMSEIINGSANSFSVDRSAAPVASDIRITIGENSPPTVIANRINVGSQISLISPTTYEVECLDSALENPTHQWEFKNNGTLLFTSAEPWVSVTPSEHGFYHGDILSVVVTCIDSHGSGSYWYENIVIDGMEPIWNASFIANPADGEPINIDSNDDIIKIGSEDILDINIIANDESGFETTIELTSNRTSDWRHVDWDDMFVQSRFPQGDHVNGIHLDIDSRHEEKPVTHYSLNMTVTDHSGNSVFHNWTIHVIDQSGPSILPEILHDGMLISSDNPAIAGEKITLDISNSYDDIDSIVETRWTLILNQEPMFENETFEKIYTFDIGSLDAGSHWFIIMAWDSKDNINAISFSISIQPSPGVDLIVWNLSYSGQLVVGDTISVDAIVQNIGSDGANARICAIQMNNYETASITTCSDYMNIPWATSSGPGVVGIEFEVPLEISGDIDFVMEWENSQLNQEGIIEINSDLYINPYSGPLNAIITVFVLVCGLAWLAHRIWGNDEIDT
tara:strand:- start:6916 stop:9042 length:2127 start_codon:yes stop_codon:yes gene_type:complete